MAGTGESHAFAHRLQAHAIAMCASAQHEPRAIVADGGRERAAPGIAAHVDRDRAAMLPAGDRVAHGVLDEWLEQQPGHRHVVQSRFDGLHDAQTGAEAHMLDREPRLQELQLVAEPCVLAGAGAQGVAEDIGEASGHVLGRRGVLVDQRGDRVEGVEQEVGVDLRAQCAQLRPRQLTPHALQCDRTAHRLGVEDARIDDAAHEQREREREQARDDVGARRPEESGHERAVHDVGGDVRAGDGRRHIDGGIVPPRGAGHGGAGAAPQVGHEHVAGEPGRAPDHEREHRRDPIGGEECPPAAPIERPEEQRERHRPQEWRDEQREQQRAAGAPGGQRKRGRCGFGGRGHASIAPHRGAGRHGDTAEWSARGDERS